MEQDGQPIADAEITLALVGRADDSSLLDVAILTDGTGKATGRIIAGNRPATFRIRASTENALPAFVDVSVSPSGFGSLRVTPQHEGARAVSEYQFNLFSGVTCAEGELMTRTAERQLIVPAGASAEFVGLPADTPIAIAAWGVSEMGHPVAYGCADGFMVTEGETTEGEVALSDMSLALDGRYELTLTLDNTSGSESAGVALEGAAATLTTSHGSDAAFLLDCLHRSLVESSDLGTAGMLEVLIDSGDAERELGRALDSEGNGASVAIGRAAATVRAMLGSVSIEGTLVFPESHEDLATWMTQTVSVNGTTPDTRVMLSVPSITEDPSGSMNAEVDAMPDRIIVREHALNLPLSGVAFQSFSTDMAAIEPGSERPGFDVDVGCNALNTWVSGRPSLVTVCEADCVNRACRRAVTDTLAAMTEALSSLDSRRSTISIHGEFTVTDADGDLHPDTLEGESFEGLWTAPRRTDGDEITGEVSGERAIGF